jgi:hypothetical protein
LRRAAVGKQLETANLIHDAVTGGSPHLLPEMIRDDQRAACGLELRLGFQNANAAATMGHARRGKKSRRGAAHDDNFSATLVIPRLVFWFSRSFVHSNTVRSLDIRLPGATTAKNLPASRSTRVGLFKV